MIPTVKVEVKFNGSWIDVSSSCDLSQGVTITRGRASEVDTIQPGTCALTLANDGGEFTPGNTGSPYYPYVSLFTPIRVSVDTSGGYVERFTGYVDSWPVSWRTSTGDVSDVSVSAVDLLGLAGLKTLRSYAENKILEWSPVCYYPLSEASGSTRADDISGNHQSHLGQVTVGTLGTFEFGNTDASPTPLEGAGMIKVDAVSGDGTYLVTDSALTTFGTSFTVVSLSLPTASGYIWHIKQGTFILGLYWNNSTSKYLVRQYDGATWSTLVSSSGTPTGLYCEIVQVTATTVTLRSDSTRTATARSAATFSSPLLYVATAPDTTSGFANRPDATIGQVAVIGSALTMTASGEADTLAGAITQAAVGFTQYADVLLESALGWAGFSGETVSYLGTRTELGFVATSGHTVASLADMLARGTLGRCAVGTDGALVWVGADYSPTILELDAADVNPGFRWETERNAYVTDLTTTLPSGISYTYASPTAGLIRASRDIVGVLPTDDECRELVQFTVSGSSLDPRIPNCAFDLLTLEDDADAEALLDVPVGGIFSLTNLPAQIPDDRVLVAEGFTERIGVREWTLEVNTSPSSRILPPAGWHFFTLDDATYGLMDTATNILSA